MTNEEKLIYDTELAMDFLEKHGPVEVDRLELGDTESILSLVVPKEPKTGKFGSYFGLRISCAETFVTTSEVYRSPKEAISILEKWLREQLQEAGYAVSLNSGSSEGETLIHAYISTIGPTKAAFSGWFDSILHALIKAYEQYKEIVKWVN